jgi:hypothetical protein
MWQAIIGFLGSAASGGITGLFGGLVNRVADYFTLKQNHAHELAMRDKDLEIAQVEASREVTIAREKNMTDREVAESETLAKSFEADRATYFSASMLGKLPKWAAGVAALLFVLVDFIRGLTRPGLTLYMCILTTVIYMEMKDIVSGSGSQPFTPEDAVKVIVMIVDAVIYLTSMCVGWWFATRTKRGESPLTFR